MVKKKSKHHSLCDIVRFHFETKRDAKHHKSFYQIIKEEDHYFMDKVRNGHPIEGECDNAAIRYSKEKRYGVVVEVKSNNNNKHYYKALRQLAKDSRYYKQLYKLDKVYCIYAYGNPKDNNWTEINYKWIPQREIDQILIK